MLNIAGITNKKRNILGMMPHPERASNSLLGSEDGNYIFESLIKNYENQLGNINPMTECY